MKKLLLFFLFALSVHAQTGGTQQGRVSLTQNASISQQGYVSGGTITVGQLVTLDSSGQVVAATTSTVNGVIGVAKNSATVSQPVDVALLGQAPTLADGACSQGQLLQISPTSDGRVNCTASVSNQQIGISDSNTVSAATITAILTGGGSGGNGGTGANQSLSNLTSPTSINQPFLCVAVGICWVGSQSVPFGKSYYAQLNDNTYPWYVDAAGNFFGASFNTLPSGSPFIGSGALGSTPPPSLAGYGKIYCGDLASFDCLMLLNGSPGLYMTGFNSATQTSHGLVVYESLWGLTTTPAGAANSFAMGNGSSVDPAFQTPTPHALSLPLLCLDTSGSGTAQSCGTTSTFTPVAGDTIVYETSTTNTGDLTINVNSSSAIHVRKWQGSAVLAAGDLVATVYVPMTYDGTYWEISTIGNAPSGVPTGTFQTNGTNNTTSTSGNFENSTTNAAGISLTFSNPSTNVEKVEATAVGTIPNSALANTGTTVNGKTCTLGSTCAPLPNVICAKFSTTDSLTANGALQTFATTCSIPANTLGTNNIIRVTVSGQVTTSASPPTGAWKITLGGTTVYSQAANAMPASLTNIPNSGIQLLIQGEAAPSGSSNVVTSGTGRVLDGSWFGGSSTTGTAQPVALATNGALTLAFSWTTSASDASTTLKLLQLLVEQVN